MRKLSLCLTVVLLAGIAVSTDAQATSKATGNEASYRAYTSYAETLDKLSASQSLAAVSTAGERHSDGVFKQLDASVDKWITGLDVSAPTVSGNSER